MEVLASPVSLKWVPELLCGKVGMYQCRKPRCRESLLAAGCRLGWERCPWGLLGSRAPWHDRDTGWVLSRALQLQHVLDNLNFERPV